MNAPDGLITIFLCGDVMTGRGVDQILGRPSDSRLYEMFVQDARTYVELAEEVNGPIPRRVDDSYVWGDALAELNQVAPDVRVANLETSVTRSDDAWPKGINSRMHPANIGCLRAAEFDVCSLANNHVLDYGYPGLVETLLSLHQAGLRTSGAGQTIAEARRPAVVELGSDLRVVIHAFGTETSGILPSWAAGPHHPGVAFLFDNDLLDETAARHEEHVPPVTEKREVTIASIHWGSNWGYEVPAQHVRFAHRLIDGGVDIVHGHSSHHPRPIEVYRNRLILYGCGDFINDYEGIRGQEEYRGDLAIMYFATVDPVSGDLAGLRMTPMQIRKMRLNRAAPADAIWLSDTLARASKSLGSWVEPAAAGSLLLRWD